METTLDIIGVVAFAISGVTKGAKYNLDILGVIVLGVITALGGGVIRDILLNQPPYSIHNPRDAYIAIATSVVTFFLIRDGGVFFRETPSLTKKLHKISRKISLNYTVQVFDALGLAVFTLMGASKAYSFHLGILPVALMATLTGVGGGMVRDILVREIPFVLKDEIYASLCIAGAVFYYITTYYQLLDYNSIAYITIIFIFIARLLAIKYQFSLPAASTKKAEENSN
jgi:uncharacterized membrane protein YeiH